MSNLDNKILIVDDLPSVCSVVKRQLAMNHFTNTSSTNSVGDAVKLLEKEDFNLIISDLHIGEEDAATLIKQMRELQKMIPVIVITSDMNREEFDEIKLLGIAGYLLKPFSSKELLSSVRKVLVK